ncbi:MAG TPA: HD-GYP domain-containing protein [Firmicutes bacterium]|nr:HD-GYP domain-containing protein [Bacillota bacterium]
MRKAAVNRLKAGMVVSRTLFGREGQVLLKAGTKIKEKYIKSLKRLGITGIYVQDERLEGIETAEVVQDSTRQEARLLVKELINEMGRNKKGKFHCQQEKKITRVVNQIVEELLANKDIVVNMDDIRTIDSYTFSHSVNVCILATLAAVKRDFNAEALQEIAVGSLLHDLGKVKIPDIILKKKGPLTEAEYAVIKSHPVYGRALLSESALCAETVLNVVYQHHERLGGQGYPQGLSGAEISVPAQITAVADVYDALVSERYYRKAYLPHQVIEMFTSWAETYFDVEVLRTFFSFLTAYPVGTHVKLSNGKSGLVIKNKPGFPLHPVVRVLY